MTFDPRKLGVLMTTELPSSSPPPAFTDVIAKTIWDVSDCERDTSEGIAQSVREKLAEEHQDLLARARTQIDLGRVTGMRTGNPNNIYQIAEELVKALTGHNPHTQKED